MTSVINPDNEIRIDWHRVGRCPIHDKQVTDSLRDSIFAEDKFMHDEIIKDDNAFLPYKDKKKKSFVNGYDISDERDSYYKAMREQRFASELVNHWMLPAHVSNGKDSCQHQVGKGCLDKDRHDTGSFYNGLYKSSCGSIGCNQCFESAIQKQAFKSSIRLTGVALALATKEIVSTNFTRYNKLNHIAISIPPSMYDGVSTEEGFEKCEKTIYQLIKVLSLRAGSLVFHPYRFEEKLKGIKGFSPHWHLLTVGWTDGNLISKIHAGEYKKNSKEVRAERKRLNLPNPKYEYDYRKFKGFDVMSLSLVDTRKSIYNVIAYQLSHAGIAQKAQGSRSSKQIVKYFGKANPRHFKTGSILSSSESAYDQIDKLLKGRESKIVKGEEYTLSKSKVSVVIFDDVSKADREYKWFNGSKSELEQYLKSHVKPRYNLKDDPEYDGLCSFVGPNVVSNAPLTNCVTSKDKFILVRLDYTPKDSNALMVSDYISIFYDPSISLLCPECSCKIKPLKLNINNIEYQDNFCLETLPMMVKEVGKLFPSDTSMGFEYLTHENMSHLGMQYFTETEILYSNGRDTKPECFDKLNDLLKVRIDANIQYQMDARVRKEAKRQEWIKDNEVYLGRGIAKPIVTQPTIKRTTNSHKLSDY